MGVAKVLFAYRLVMTQCTMIHSHLTFQMHMSWNGFVSQYAQTLIHIYQGAYSPQGELFRHGHNSSTHANLRHLYKKR